MKQPTTMPPLVLASGSPYRAEILSKLKLNFLSCAPHVDETIHPGETADSLARRLSIAKAQALSTTYPNHLIIGSDQVVLCGNRILNKPGNREQAIRQLELQSGCAVDFYTGLCVLDSCSGNQLIDLDYCSVRFKTLTTRQIESYLDKEQPYDCAGSFKAESLGIALFDGMSCNDPNTLIGLPLIKLITLLAQCGVEVL
jgi:septum formation protein